MLTKNLLLCFDAYGTLFRPRAPVHHQYAEVARTLGLRGFSDDDVLKSFKAGKPIARHIGDQWIAKSCKSFQARSSEEPKLRKIKWSECGEVVEQCKICISQSNSPYDMLTVNQIIRNTFQPLVGPEQALPADLVPKLLHRFWCDEGYMLYPDVQPLLRQIRDLHHAVSRRVVVGVITNSDDRVPTILTSLGMTVGKLRFGGDIDRIDDPNAATNDVDFSVMSYDVGHEKPDARVFRAGEHMLQVVLGAQDSSTTDFDAGQWSKVYIGDEFEKDVLGAVGAGWKAVLIDRENARPKNGLEWLDHEKPGDLFGLLDRSNAVGFSSLAKLSDWLRVSP